MGTALSTSAKVQPHGRQEDIVRVMMPLYYTTELLSEKEYDAVKSCWTSIVTSTAPFFLALRREGKVSQMTCITYFYNSFYARLFDIHPTSKDLFKDVQSQGKFLVKMLSLALTEPTDPVGYENTLVHLAHIHNERGIKAIEYGMVGDVLFWSLCMCVGSQVYNDEMHLAWTKVFSRMLRTMIPIAVAYELKEASAKPMAFDSQPIWRLTDEVDSSKDPADHDAALA